MIFGYDAERRNQVQLHKQSVARRYALRGDEERRINYIVRFSKCIGLTYKIMSRSRYQIYENEYPYFLTSSVVHGLPIFANKVAANIVLDSLEYLQLEKGTTIYAYVVMVNHIHLIAKSDSLVKDISALKSYTARKIIDYLKEHRHTNWLRKLREQKADYKRDRKYQLWQEGYHPKQIIGDDMMLQKVEYIHNNPVKRGYVDNPEDWRYSSARNYLGKSGLIPVTVF